MDGGGTTSATATVTMLVVDRANTLNVRADAFSVPAGSVSNALNVLENDNILPGNGEDCGHGVIGERRPLVDRIAVKHATVEQCARGGGVDGLIWAIVLASALSAGRMTSSLWFTTSLT